MGCIEREDGRSSSLNTTYLVRFASAPVAAAISAAFFLVDARAVAFADIITAAAVLVVVSGVILRDTLEQPKSSVCFYQAVRIGPNINRVLVLRCREKRGGGSGGVDVGSGSGYLMYTAKVNVLGAQHMGDTALSTACEAGEHSPETHESLPWLRYGPPVRERKYANTVGVPI